MKAVWLAAVGAGCLVVDVKLRGSAAPPAAQILAPHSLRLVHLHAPAGGKAVQLSPGEYANHAVPANDREGVKQSLETAIFCH